MQNIFDLSLSMVVAMTLERVIGFRNRLPWDIIRSDRKHFAALTRQTGVVIMGRKTFESIVEANGRPLPDRFSIVLTSRPAKAESVFRAKMKKMKIEADVTFVSSVEEALFAAKKYCATNNRRLEAFVIGGGEVYETFLPLTSKIYATTIEAVSSGDTFFPVLPATEWQLTSETEMTYQCAGDPYRTAYIEYKRIVQPAERAQVG